ncbi:hypothetical protein MHYP_G00110200 [Metynnis hypsauchen]
MAPRKREGKKIGEARDLSQSVGRLAANNISFSEVSIVDSSNPAVAVGKLHEFKDMLYMYMNIFNKCLTQENGQASKKQVLTVLFT